MFDNIIREAAEKFNTPFYLYDHAVLARQYQLLADALQEKADIFYSLKANPNITIARALSELGAGAEVCSFLELHAALNAGFSPSNIICVGPAKSNEFIRYCLLANISLIICESINEYDRINTIANKLNVKARVVLRVNPDFYNKSALLKMGGKPSQFGMDESFVFDHVAYFKKASHITLHGIHIYNGTRILDAASIIENTHHIFNISKRYQQIFNLPLEVVGIGGGIGVPYFAGESEFDIAEFKAGIQPIISDFREIFPHVQLILESGRYLTALSGCLVSRVIDVKQSKGECFIITDGGTNCHMAAVGIGGVVKRNFPIRLVSQHKRKETETCIYQITGPLCTPNDLIAKNIEFPSVEVGDWIVIERSGAYGPTASPTHFLSHGFPAEIMLKNDQLVCIRQPDTVTSFFANQLN